jgi:sugar phosphate isomerase/epimerase
MRWGCCAGPELGGTLDLAGYDYIELSISRHLQPEATMDQWRFLLHAIEEQPLPVEAFNTFLPSDLKVVGPDVDEARIQRYLRVAFERASDLGGQIVVFGSGGARAIPDGFARERARQQLVDFTRRAGDEAGKTEITLCIEPLNRSECNVLNDLDEAVRLAQDADHPHVHALADFYHMMREDEPLGRMISIGDWVSHVHVADTDRRVPGLGSYPYPTFFYTLRQIGYDQRCSIECRWENLEDQCGPALDFLRRTWDASAS